MSSERKKPIEKQAVTSNLAISSLQPDGCARSTFKVYIFTLRTFRKVEGEKATDVVACVQHGTDRILGKMTDLDLLFVLAILRVKKVITTHPAVSARLEWGTRDRDGVMDCIDSVSPSNKRGEAESIRSDVSETRYLQDAL